MKKLFFIATAALFLTACSQEQADQTKAEEQAKKRLEAAQQYESKFSIDDKKKD